MPRYRYNGLSLIPNEETWNKALKGYKYQLEEKERQLTKYKKAFEILKKNIVPNQDIESLMDIMVWREDNEEEYELLEELMKGE